MANRKKRRITGLTNGRVGWTDGDFHNLTCTYLAERGFHAHTIADMTGLSLNQVHYRNKMVGLSLRDYRNGVGPAARLIVDKYNITTISSSTSKQERTELRRNAIGPEAK